MFSSRLMATLLTLCVALVSAPLAANTAHSPHGEAASLYDQGDYSKAYKHYHKLAKKGDTFAQYRVSYMTLKGLGTRPDVVESLAWAVLAAEGENEVLDRYQSAVAAMVPGDQRKKAEKKADYFVRRWGREDKANGGELARKSEGVCTGSRLAGNCGMSGSASGYWITWGQDRSSDPAHHEHIEELNSAIVENAARLKSNTTGS